MNKVPILLYHDLESASCPTEKEGAAARDTVVDSVLFEEQMKYLCDEGYQTVSLRDFFDAKDGNAPIRPKQIILTFDDGHISNYSLAFPILRKLGMRATFFIPSARIGEDGHLNASQIRTMIQEGMEIGSHGRTHDYLPLLGPEAIREELCESKKCLEAISGQAVQFLAYPGGHFNRETLKWVFPCGYRGACSCRQGLNHLNTDPLLLRRIEVRRRMGSDDFRRLLNPGQIYFYRVIDAGKELVRKSIGLNAYSHLRKRFYGYYRFKR